MLPKFLGENFFGNSIFMNLVSKQDKMLPKFSAKKFWGDSMFRFGV